MPSRDSKVRAGAAADASVTTGRTALRSPALGHAGLGSPSLGNAAGPGQQQATAPGQRAPSGARPSRRSLKNWRVRSRLLLLIIIPTLTALVLGGTRIVTSVQNALAYQRVEQLANLSSSVTELASALQDERDQTVQFIAAGGAGRAGDDGAQGRLPPRAPSSSRMPGHLPSRGSRRSARSSRLSGPAIRRRSRLKPATSTP